MQILGPLRSGFSTTSNTSKLVRIYAASDCDTAKEILSAAKASVFQVILGIWYDYLMR
jgi:glucan 1,3-beta-glucosidase